MGSTRWVLHPEAAERIPTAPLLSRLGDDVARDAAVIVHKKTGRTSQNIRVTEVSDDEAIVTASPRNPKSSPGNQAYAAHLERGTSDTEAQPFMRPALYQYRTPGSA